MFLLRTQFSCTDFGCINLKDYGVLFCLHLFCYFCFERHSCAVKTYTFVVVRFDVLVEKRLYQICPERLVV